MTNRGSADSTTRTGLCVLGILSVCIVPLSGYAADCKVSYSYNPDADAPALATGTAEADEGQTVNATRTRVRKVTNIANHPVEIQVTQMVSGVASGTKWVSLSAKDASDPPGGTSYSQGVTLYTIKCLSPAATPPPSFANPQALISSFKAAGKNATEIAVGLKSTFAASTSQVAGFMKTAGFSPAQVAGALKSAFTASASSVAGAMKAAGFTIAEVTSAVNATFAVPNAQAMAWILKQAGYSLQEIAAWLRPFHQTDAQLVAMVQLLDALNDQKAQRVDILAGTLRGVGVTANDAAKALRAALGVSADLVAAALRSVYQLGEAAVQQALQYAGYAITAFQQTNIIGVPLLGSPSLLSPTPPAGFFTPQNPKLLVIVHGATDTPYKPSTAIRNQLPLLPDHTPSNTLKYSREYWGFDLVLNLLGASTPTLHTFSGQQLGPGTWETTATNDTTVNDWFVATAPFRGGTPPISALLTFRDGAAYLVPQVEQTVEQVYNAYAEKFGSGLQPQIIWVVHSMGGLVGRTIFTNPDNPIGGQILSPGIRQKADALRNRTLYMITLQTPHEGSPLADKFAKFKALASFSPPLLQYLQQDLGVDSVRETVLSWLGITAAVEHLQSSFWDNMNRTWLAPHRATRTDGSLIPIYALGGRSASGRFFHDPNEPRGGLFDQPIPVKQTTLGLMWMDWLVHNIPIPGTPDTWGNHLPYPGGDTDSIRRAYRKVGSPLLSLPAEKDSLLGLDLLIPGAPPIMKNRMVERMPMFYLDPTRFTNLPNDLEADTDGMVGLNSALGLQLGTTSLGYFDHTREWDIPGRTTRGSWYRLYSGPWNWNNHASMRDDGVTGRWLFDNIVRDAGPYIGAAELSTWPSATPSRSTAVPPPQ